LLRPRVPSGEGLAFSPTDPDLLVVKPLLGSPLELDLATGRTNELKLAGGGLNLGFGVAFDPAGTEIAVPAGDLGITVIDARSGQTLRTLAFPNNAPYFTAFNAKGSQLAAVGANGKVVVWDTGDWSKIAEVDTGAGFAPALRFLPDGRLVAFGDTALAVIGRPAGRPALVQRAVSLGARTVLDLGVVAGAGRVALVDERDGERGVALVDPDTGHDIRRVRVAGATALSVTPDGSLIAVGTEHGHVELLRADTLATSATMKGANEGVLDLVVAGGQLAIAGATSVEAWDISGPAPVELLRRRLPPNPEDVPTGVAIDPYGHELVVNHSSQRLVIDLRTGRVLRRLRYVSGGPVAFDPADGSLLAVAGGSPGFFDSDTLARVGNAPAYAGLLQVLAFSPDGALLVSGGSTASFALADVAARRPIGPAIGGPKDAGLAAMAFFPDRPTLVVAYNTTVSTNAQLLQWDLDLGSWSARACQGAGRNLTREEWDRELPGHTYHRTCKQWPADT
jgi:WD40 repeat protein